jgi:SAM-dependent methyltransferase
MHATIDSPSAWITRFCALIAAGGTVLDLACGSGRHARYLAQQRACTVLAVDRDASVLASLAGVAHIETQVVDLEGDAWPLAGATFDAVIVTNYLWRPRLDDVIALLKPNGVLLYETFAAGNEAYGKPSRADFLLQPNELLARIRNRLQVVAFEQGVVAEPKPAVVQRIAALGPARLWPTDLPA